MSRIDNGNDIDKILAILTPRRGANVYARVTSDHPPSSALNVSLMTFHSGLSAGSSCCMVSTIRYIMLSSTLRSVLSASEMAGLRTALLQAALLLRTRK